MAGSLTVVGTGFLVAGQVTPEALACIKAADRLLYLVVDPVTRVWLRRLHPDAVSLYSSYAEGRSRRESYAEMVERILAPVRQGLKVCAAFYGHPGVFVNPSHGAIRQARAEGIRSTMLPGISAEDCLFADLEIDPASGGCQSFEATDFLVHGRRFDPTAALVLWQIGAIGVATFMNRDLWSRDGLRVLAAALQDHYSGDHEVVIYEAAQLPTCEPVILPVRLRDLAAAPVSLISTLYVPPRPAPPPDAGMLRRLGLPRAPRWARSVCARPPQRPGQGQDRGSLTVVGTGYAVAGQITPETSALIQDADEVLYLVSDPATGAYLRRLNRRARTLHDCYREGRSGAAACAEMVERILVLLQRGARVCVAVYGHPAVFVPPALQALREARRRGFRASMRPAISAEDCLFADLGVDPGPVGRCLYEATDFLLHRRVLDTAGALVLLQPGAVGLTRYRHDTAPNRDGLQLLAEALQRHYPADHTAVIYETASLPVLEPLVERTCIADLARADLSVSSTLYVPPLSLPRRDPAVAEQLSA